MHGSSQRVRLHRLEALRGFVALYVVLHHALPHHVLIGGLDFGFVLRFGQEAVILFFLLSGFVIHLSHSLACDRSFRLYLVKRLARIYIPLLFTFVVAYVITAVRQGSLPDPQFHNLVMNILMLQDIGALKPGVLAEPYLGIAPLWSLSYEWWFYIMYYPIERHVPSAAGQDRLVFAAAIAAAIGYLFSPEFLPRLIAYFGIWWSGVHLARACIESRPIGWRQIALPVSSLLLIACVLSMSLLSDWEPGQTLALGVHPILEVRHFMFASVALVVAVAWRKSGWIGYRWTLQPFIPLAAISYSIYISHYVLVVNANYLGNFTNPVVNFMIYFSVMIVFAISIERLMYPLARDRMIRFVQN